MDSDTLANISCGNGDIPKWDAVVGVWDCALDRDTLVDLNCSAGEIAKWDGNFWSCGSDVDTKWTNAELQIKVEAMTLDFQNQPQVNGVDVLTTDSIQKFSPSSN